MFYIFIFVEIYLRGSYMYTKEFGLEMSRHDSPWAVIGVLEGDQAAQGNNNLGNEGTIPYHELWQQKFKIFCVSWAQGGLY